MWRRSQQIVEQFWRRLRNSHDRFSNAKDGSNQLATSKLTALSLSLTTLTGRTKATRSGHRGFACWGRRGSCRQGENDQQKDLSAPHCRVNLLGSCREEQEISVRDDANGAGNVAINIVIATRKLACQRSKFYCVNPVRSRLTRFR